MWQSVCHMLGRAARAATAARLRSAMATIATHDGTFHADEALACFLLHQTAAFRDARAHRLPRNSGAMASLIARVRPAAIVRTRNPEKIAAATIAVDVGGEYDPARHRYDHHQRSFTTTFSPAHTVTKLSSAGLIYKHFGQEVIANVLGWPHDDARLELVFLKVYENFIEAMDAVDNGVAQVPGTKPLYKNNTTLSHRVGGLNPSWNEEPGDMMERFSKAMQMTGSEFCDSVKGLALSWLPARSIVEEALDTRDDSAPLLGRIITLPQFCPWKEHLFDLEEERAIPPDRRVIYVIYADSSGGWRVQAVPESPDSFDNRKALPEPWRGVRDDDLSKLTGIDDCVFVHASGFIGGNKTREGAMSMARAALLWT